MKKIYLLLISLVTFGSSFSQSKSQYLKDHRYDLRDETFVFPENDFNIIGFGAYHGSVKTEEAAFNLMKSVNRSGEKIKYYFVESDQSIGHYFNQFLESGDEQLLVELIKKYGWRISQEANVDHYNMWLKFKVYNDQLPNNEKITVLGIDAQVDYKFTFKHLMELLPSSAVDWSSVVKMKNELEADTTDFSPYYDSHSKAIVREFIEEYNQNKSSLNTSNKMLDHVVHNLSISLDQYKREEVIYDNYLRLKDMLGFEKDKQFMRYGFFHLGKSREYPNYPSFFTRIIEGGIYPKDQIISVTGYLTDSEVLWDNQYDDDGNYTGYTTKAGFGIGDYWKEYFRGVKKLKKNKVSDITLYRLNDTNTPYADGVPDLIHVRMITSKSNGKRVKGKSTTDFIDYAILISDSEASKPVYELDQK